MERQLKTLYIWNCYSQLPKPGTYFVIGVKENQNNSLEAFEFFLKENGFAISWEKFPEVVNCKYIDNPDTWKFHILQPAFITIERK